MDLCNINDIKALLAKHNFRFSKSMGQNFLIEEWVPQQIAEASGAKAGVGVLEIGPGIGPLTVQLARRADKVVSVELDHALLPILADTLSSYPNAQVVSGDILKTDIPALVSDKLNGLTPIVCANLPYNITTPVLTTLIESHLFSAITVMIQREVAKRCAATPGTSDYGAFSVFCQYYTHPELLFEVPPTCFIPAPKVTSAVIRFTQRTAPAQTLVSDESFFKIVRAAFAQRRKTLLNSLHTYFGGTFSKEDLRGIITGCGLPEDIRGERLGIQEFAQIALKLL